MKLQEAVGDKTKRAYETVWNNWRRFAGVYEGERGKRKVTNECWTFS